MSEVEPVPQLACPVCGRPVETITRGRTHVNGPMQPTTYGPCGCQPAATLGESDCPTGEQVVAWAKHHDIDLTQGQADFLGRYYSLPPGSKVTGARIFQSSNPGIIDWPDNFEHIEPPFRRLNFNEWLDESHYFIGPEFHPDEEQP